MRLRSLLFVPGDRPERMAKAVGMGADGLILDLEDAVAPDAKARAREEVARFLAQPREAGVRLFVRINPVDGPLAADDLAAILPARPDGIVLPKAEGLVSLHALAARGVTHIPILPIATETPMALFRLHEYAGSPLPLAGLTWGAEDLPAAIGAATSREADGGYTAPYQFARSLTLFGAHAAAVAAIETVYPDFADLDGLAAYAARGRRDGFTGMMAIHPRQVPVINAAFTPTSEELAHAQAIVDLFAAHPGSGVLQLNGKMLDAPHLKAAQALLARATP